MKNIKTEITRQEKAQTLVNITSINVLICIINNPGIDALKISKKIKMPQASVYRTLFNLIKTDFLDTMHKKPGWRGGNSTIMYASKAKQFQIIIDSKGIHVY